MSVPQGGSRRPPCPVHGAGRRGRPAVGADHEVETGRPARRPAPRPLRALVRLATLVVGDVGMAEQMTQDAFVRLQLRWGRVHDPDRAPAYLRSAVLNGARSQLRHRRVGDRHDARRTVAPATVTPEAATRRARRARAGRRRAAALPRRQREAVALSYYLDLSEADIAAAMGVSGGSVKTHLHRGLAALAQELGEEPAMSDDPDPALERPAQRRAARRGRRHHPRLRQPRADPPPRPGRPAAPAGGAPACTAAAAVAAAGRVRPAHP